MQQFFLTRQANILNINMAADHVQLIVGGKENVIAINIQLIVQLYAFYVLTWTQTEATVMLQMWE